MHPKSASALVWAAVIVDILGLTVISPSGQFMLSLVAAVLALVPTVFGRKVPQIAGAIVLVLSLALVVTVYPKFEKASEEYLSRAKERAKKGVDTSPPQMEPKK
jgi:membrane protein implicated in regulation of membrane protease activity